MTRSTKIFRIRDFFEHIEDSLQKGIGIELRAHWVPGMRFRHPRVYEIKIYFPRKKCSAGTAGGSVCSLRTGAGVSVAVIAAVLLVITAIAIAAIVAPPFFATAILASAALPVAIGTGIGALISVIIAAVLLKNRAIVDDSGIVAPAPDITTLVGKIQAIRAHRNYNDIFKNEVNKILALSNSSGPDKITAEEAGDRFDQLLTDLENYDPIV